MKNTSTHLGLVQVEPQSYEVTVATTATPLVPAAITVTKYRALPIGLAFIIGAGELTSSGTVATVAHTAHGFKPGDMVNILGCTQTEYNGLFRVETVADANTFTYNFASSTTSPATSTTRMVACKQSAIGLKGDLELTFTAGHVKRWLKAGTVISVTGFGTTLALNKKYRVKSVDYTANTALLYAPEINDFSVWSTLTTEAAAAAMDVHGQRFIIRVPSAGATITVGPNLNSLAVPYGYRLTVAADAEREFIAPSGAKWDMADWGATVASSTQVVQIYVV